MSTDIHIYAYAYALYVFLHAYRSRNWMYSHRAIHTIHIHIHIHIYIYDSVLSTACLLSDHSTLCGMYACIVCVTFLYIRVYIEYVNLYILQYIYIIYIYYILNDMVPRKLSQQSYRTYGFIRNQHRAIFRFTIFYQFCSH